MRLLIVAATGFELLPLKDYLEQNFVHKDPDVYQLGDVQVTFKTRFYPNGTERSYGPYLPANPTDVRFTGREVRMRVEGRDAQPASWRWGIPRVDAVAGGRR